MRQVSKPFFPLVRPWVAGEHATDAILEVKRLNHSGCKGLVNFLGEHYKDPQLVEHAVHEYRHLIHRLATEKKQNPGFLCAISLKPSQFGFDLEFADQNQNQQTAFLALHHLVFEAMINNIPVELDMEHSKYTDFTLDTYRKLLVSFQKNNVGIRVCLQANLKRSHQDLLNLVSFAKQHSLQPSVRLVKGVYLEKNNSDAFSSEKEKMHSFFGLVELAFENAAFLDIAIATHRRDIVSLADALSKKTGFLYELQLLRGIGSKIKQERLAKNQAFTEYVPYGKDSIAYGARRIKQMLWLTLTGPG